MADPDAGEPVFFETEADLRAWLEANHETAAELIAGMWKKKTGVPSIHWEELRDQALCFGWIDGIGRRIDDDRHQIRITPRRRNSIWSNVNVQRFAELEAEGRMTEAGRAAFALRRDDRTGIYASENKETAELSPEYAAMLNGNPAAAEFFAAQPPGYRRTAIHLVMSAKREETRRRRLAQLIADSAAGLRIKQLRR